MGIEQQYSTGSASAAQEPVGQLAMSGHIFGCHTGRGWAAGVLLASGVERLGMLLSIPRCTKQPSTHAEKNDPPSNVSIAEVEKPWSGGTAITKASGIPGGFTLWA